MVKPFPAYEGDEPYVFVSYSHEDESAVYKEIRWLQDQRVNVWYGEGRSPGTEWSDALANAIVGCTHFVYFLTPRSAVSENCRRELVFAQQEHRQVLAVYLEETDVPSGIRLSLDNHQAVLKHRLKPGSYESRLLTAVKGPGVGHPGQRQSSQSMVLIGDWSVEPERIRISRGNEFRAIRPLPMDVLISWNEYQYQRQPLYWLTPSHTNKIINTRAHP